jgi:formate hydrogenlyase transcriptional activator
MWPLAGRQSVPCHDSCVTSDRPTPSDLKVTETDASRSKKATNSPGIGVTISPDMSSPAYESSLSLAGHYERLKLIVDIGKRLSSNLDLHSLLRDIASTVRRTLDTDVVGVWVPNAQETHLQLYAVDFPGSLGVASEGLLIPVEGTFIGDILKRGVPEVSDFADPALKLSEGETAIVHAEGIRFGYASPMYVRDRKLGIFSLGRKTDKPFTADDVEMADLVAQQVAIALSNAIAYKDIADLKDRLAKEKVYLEDEIRSELNFSEIVGKSTALRKVLNQVETVAPTDSTVLIYGETGTGKELIARAIHDRSKRRAGTFVKLNCAAIPTGLLESELFGHEKGAFTGAIAQRIGRFELANRGTVFLDEVGEIPLELQPKLLRVLQEREFERLGSTRTLRTDARLIAATNRDLEAMVEGQKFRSDLFYRLNVFPVRVPSLRERPEDIPLLVRHFTQQFARNMNKNIESIPSETMSALCEYHWPGNIRELQNVIERAVILSSGPVLRVVLSDLKGNAASMPALENLKSPSRAENLGSMQRVLEETERKQILAALEESRWVVAGPNGAAALLGMKRSTLQVRMQKLRITRSASPA